MKIWVGWHPFYEEGVVATCLSDAEDKAALIEETKGQEDVHSLLRAFGWIFTEVEMKRDWE